MGHESWFPKALPRGCSIFVPRFVAKGTQSFGRWSPRLKSTMDARKRLRYIAIRFSVASVLGNLVNKDIVRVILTC